MRRRDILAGSSASLVAALAGCGQFQSGDQATSDESTTPTDQIEAADSGPPYFEKVQVTGPSTVSVNEEFSIEIRAANTGGRTGDFTASLQIGSGAFSVDQGIRISEIEPGERQSTALDGLVSKYAGTYTFSMPDYATSHTVEVTPQVVSGGQRAEVEDGVSAAFSFRSLAAGLFRTQEQGTFSDEGTTTTVAKPSGDFFAVVYADISNNSDETFRFLDGSFSIDPLNSEWSDPAIQGESLRDIELAPGYTASGWILMDVLESDARQGLSFGYDKDFSEPVDVRWEFPPRNELPDLITTALDIPESVEIGSEASIDIEATNSGGAPGRYRLAIERQNANAESDVWYPVETVTGVLAPDEELQKSITISEPYLGASVYKISPLGERTPIDFTPAQREFGSSYRTAEDRVFRIQFRGFSPSYQYDGYDNPTVEADGKFAIVQATVSNESEESLSIAGPDLFTALAGGTTSQNTSEGKFSGDITSPVSGDFYEGGFGYDPGEQSSGFMFFDVPSGTAMSDLTIQLEATEGGFSSEGELEILWSE